MKEYKKIFESWQLKGYQIPNRVCVPPLVIYTWSDDSGKVADKEVEHYREYLSGGAGLVIQEATSISRAGRLTLDQLGIWSDEHVEGLKRIVAEFHKAGKPAILQLSHAGILSAGRENQVCPSDYTCYGNYQERVGRELTIEEIKQIEKDYIEAARRAVEAGYDGLELHCCHGYLLSEFLNSRINVRTDEYNAADGLIVKNIILGIKAIVPEDFILGIRLGSFEPGLEEGIAHAKWVESLGVDYINSYVGCDWENDLFTPEGYPFNASIYGAECTKKAVSVPVFTNLGIRTADQAEAILEQTGVDAVVIARGHLVNPHWTNDVREGKFTGHCYECEVCQWKVAPDKCPGHIELVKKQAEA